MLDSRRSFLKQLGGVVSALVGGTGLSGCLGEDDAQSSSATTRTQSAAQSAPIPLTSPPPSIPLTSPPPPDAPPAVPADNSPVWQPSPSIEFVEGVPGTVSVRDFVRDPDSDPLVITLNSGTLLPGLTWNPTNYTIAYDGRPLGAKDDAPIVVTGLTFTADDGRP